MGGRGGLGALYAFPLHATPPPEPPLHSPRGHGNGAVWRWRVAMAPRRPPPNGGRRGGTPRGGGRDCAPPSCHLPRRVWGTPFATPAGFARAVVGGRDGGRQPLDRWCRPGCCRCGVSRRHPSGARATRSYSARPDEAPRGRRSAAPNPGGVGGGGCGERPGGVPVLVGAAAAFVLGRPLCVACLQPGA